MLIVGGTRRKGLYRGKPLERIIEHSLADKDFCGGAVQMGFQVKTRGCRSGEKVGASGHAWHSCGRMAVSSTLLQCPPCRPMRTTDQENAFETAQRIILDYVDRRSGGNLPAEAREGRSFELHDLRSQHVVSVAIDEPRYWTVRFDDQDKEVAERRWVIETALAEQAGEKPALFGLRLNASF